MFTKIRVITTILLTTLLVACGGGGDGGGGGSAPMYGVFEGTNSAGWDTEYIVLEDGAVWGIYGTNVGGRSTINGMLQASGSFSGTTYFASNIRDYYYTGSVGSGTITASYLPEGRWSGTLSESKNITFVYDRISTSVYNYDTPANLSEISGAWSGGMLTGSTATLLISSSGTFSGIASNGCNVTGSLVPRASGKNIFNVNLTFGASPCVPAGATVYGIK